MRLIDSDAVVRIVREEVRDEDNTLPVSFRAGVDYVLKIMDELPENDTSKIITADTAGNSLTLKINQSNCSNQSDCEAKAIPIEWIKNRIKILKLQLREDKRHGRGQIIKMGEWEIHSLEWLLEDWEEENETNK